MSLVKTSRLPLTKWGVISLVTISCLILNTSKISIKATQVHSSHIGTFEGSTTFTTISESEVNPELFIEVMDRKGNLTQYASENGQLTIQNTHEGTYIAQAKLLGKTKYKDKDTGELLDTWESGRNLELVSVQNPSLTITGKNLFDKTQPLEIGTAGSLTGKTWDEAKLQATGVDRVRTVNKIRVTPNTTYTISSEKLRFCVLPFNENGIGIHEAEWNSNPYTFKTDENTHYIALLFSYPDNRQMTIEDVLTNFVQLEMGSETTNYTPYQSSEITFTKDMNLRSIEGVRDELDLTSGELTQRIKEIRLDGSSDERSLIQKVPDSFQPTDTTLNLFDIRVVNPKLDSVCFSDKFPMRESQSSSMISFESVRVHSENKAVRLAIAKTKAETVEELIHWFLQNPTTILYKVSEESNNISINHTYTFPPITVQLLDVMGTIQPTILSLTTPTEALSFSLNPNQEKNNQFIAPTFKISNDNYVPLTIELKEFKQITSVFNDVLPDYYESWEELTQNQSKNIALGLVPKPSEGWETLNDKIYYVANGANQQIGTSKGKSSVEFTFSALHGISFAEPLNPQYQLTFVFDLLN